MKVGLERFRHRIFRLRLQGGLVIGHLLLAIVARPGNLKQSASPGKCRPITGFAGSLQFFGVVDIRVELQSKTAESNVVLCCDVMFRFWYAMLSLPYFTLEYYVAFGIRYSGQHIQMRKAQARLQQVKHLQRPGTMQES